MTRATVSSALRPLARGGLLALGLALARAAGAQSTPDAPGGVPAVPARPQASAPASSVPAGSPSGVPTGTGPTGTGPTGTGTTAPGNATLPGEYVRQTFRYPADGRADPMQPPASLGASGNEADLSVAGIVLDASAPERSSAMIRAKGFDRTRYVVRVGDAIEQYRVVAIAPTAVTLSVPVLGGRRQIVLQRNRDRQGGARPAGPGGPGAPRTAGSTVVTELGTTPNGAPNGGASAVPGGAPGTASAAGAPGNPGPPAPGVPGVAPRSGGSLPRRP